MTQPPNGDPFPPPGGSPTYPPAGGGWPPAQPTGGAWPPPQPPAQPGAGGAWPPPQPPAQPGAGGAWPPPQPAAGEAWLPPQQQPGAADPWSQQPVSGGPQPTGYPVPPPGYGPVGPGGQPVPPAAAPRKRRGLVIVSVVLGLALLLCGGGGTAAFFVLRNAEKGTGAPSPTEAVDGFLTAVYTDQDATKAAAMVCSAARDKKEITDRVKQIKNLADTYKNPRFTWSPPKLDEQNKERAVVSTKVTMATGDEKVSHQQLKFVVVQQTGWWVCEVS